MNQCYLAHIVIYRSGISFNMIYNTLTLLSGHGQNIRKRTEASMDPRDVEIMSPKPSYFMLTCLGIPRHDDKKYVNMST